MLLFVSQEILANSTFVYKDITYRREYYKNYVSVGINKGVTGDVVIPSTVVYDSENYSVRSIGSSAFEGCTGLTSITIPSGVTSIDNSAFEGCTGLTSITIPSGVTSIGSSAFEGCTGLTSITIPSSVTSIESYTFERCTGLTSITIPNSITSIIYGAFSGCTSLTSIEIPSSVTSIDRSAFSRCTGFTSIIVDKNNKVYDSRNNCNAIVETATNTLLLGCNNTMIPNSIASIGYGAFYGCSGLAFIEIPGSVTSIGRDAFSGCTGLTSIIVDENNKVYDSRDNCNAIVETATNTLLRGCNNTMIPNSITSIGSSAFDGCTGLTSIGLPSGVTSIGSSAFEGCTGLTSITIPSSVTSIYGYAFEGCTSLTSIEISGGVTSIEYFAFCGCTGLTYITIPSSVKSIGSEAFYYCTGLTSIEILSNDMSIGDGTFRGCTGLKSVVSMIEDPSDATKFFDENLDYKNCKLYVPCDVLDIYKVEAGWRKFKNKECIEARHIDEPLDDVVITPSNTKVVVAWPVVDNAESYVIEIKTGGKTFCVATFNNKGQLLSIEYSSASERMAEARDASATYGYQYSIASLTPETQYNYTITALDASERTLSLKSGSFTTTREPVSVDEQSAEPEFKDKVYVQDKNVMVEGLSADDYSIYNTAGKQVSNPVPASGVYVVKVGDEAVKVMVK